MSSWRNVYLDLLPICLIGLFGFLILRYMSCLYTLENNPLSIVSFSNREKVCLFILFIVSFAERKLLSFSLIKETRIYNGEKTASSISGALKSGQLHLK